MILQSERSGAGLGCHAVRSSTARLCYPTSAPAANEKSPVPQKLCTAPTDPPIVGRVVAVRTLQEAARTVATI